MKKAPTTKALILFTFLFILLAAFSFACFTKPGDISAEIKKTTEAAAPSADKGEMLWDIFSRRLVSFGLYK